MIKTHIWIACISAAAVALAVIAYRLASAKVPGQVVQIIQDGVVVEEIDLSRVREEYSLTLKARDGGYNTILVQPGRICVSDADCPDRICVLQGWLSDQSIPIACVPHHLLILLQAPKDSASPAGGDAVTQ